MLALRLRESQTELLHRRDGNAVEREDPIPCKETVAGEGSPRINRNNSDSSPVGKTDSENPPDALVDNGFLQA